MRPDSSSKKIGRSCSAAALILACAAAPACGNAVLGIQLDLVTKVCPGAAADGSRDPVAGVTDIRVRLTGDNLEPMTVTAPYSAGAVKVPNIPVGTNRRVTVEALKGPAVRARADSGLFDASGPDDLKLRLYLHVVDAFTLTGDAASATCTQMTVARAGHAMANLPDGRVLITGGFSVNSSGQLVPHGEAEIFDPATGQFATVPSSQFRRSGHSALQVAVGGSKTGILVLGGEGFDDSGAAAGPIKELELFASGLWRTVQPAPATPAREHQAAAVDLRTGYALVVGGQSGPDSRGPAVFDTASYYDPMTGAVRDVATHLGGGAVTDAVAVPRLNKVANGPAQGGIVLVGGRDRNLAVSKQISALLWRDTANDFVNDAVFAVPELSSLPTPRANHAALRLADDTILTAGGVTAYGPLGLDYAAPTDAVTIIDPSKAYVADVARLVQPRADACAAVLEDGSVLVAGGAWRDGNGLHAGQNAELIKPAGRDTTVRNLQGPAQGSGWSLQQGRYRASCLRLRNGSVLVTGGLNVTAAGAIPSALQSAELYTPASATAP